MPQPIYFDGVSSHTICPAILRILLRKLIVFEDIGTTEAIGSRFDPLITAVVVLGHCLSILMQK